MKSEKKLVKPSSDLHSPLYVDRWFKMPPKEKLNSRCMIVIAEREHGKKQSKSIKKKRSKKSG